MTKKFNWTDAKIKELVELRLKNKSYEEIGALFGVTTSSISNYISRRKEDPRFAAIQGIGRVRKYPWSPKKVETAVEMWKQGHSEKSIAKFFKVPVFAFHHLKTEKRELFAPRRSHVGLAHEAARQPKPKAPQRNPVLQATRKKVKKIDIDALFSGGDGSVGDGSKYRIPGIESVAFLNVKHNQCMFLLSAAKELNGPTTECCGSPVSLAPYCDAHRAIIYRQPIQRY